MTKAKITILGRKPLGEPGPVDVWIGHRIQMRINQMGLAQTFMAAKLGVSVLQFRRYLSAENRLTVQRLYDVAHLLRIHPAWFYEGSPELPLYEGKDVGEQIEGLLTPEMVRFVGIVSKLKPDVRRLVTQVAEGLAKGSGT
jgi:transcriptional regulator with XRE-family HTH domain